MPKRAKSPAKQLRDDVIRSKIAAGEKVKDVAKDIGLSAKSVSAILNGEETKQIIKESKSQITALAAKAVQAITDALEVRGDKQDISLRAAIAVLKSLGVLVEKTEHEFKFPKPTVIRRPNGETVILGVKESDED